ncbi:MAG TPA: 2,3-diaminopropionate biosynthesis protein SbnB [Thermoanaerobaculia bacterium]|jgi:ornithine cyclodeaminase|nr:2,3-diaminopropionate biosynthesis protein SbnB [Thermoanaerobaculia bacterium]
MKDDEILILRGGEVADLLAGRERDVLDAVARAYLAHSRGASSLPHSTFLRFPHDDLNRIIALPAFLGDGFGVAGVKWVASFPGNVRKGMARASAVLILNSPATGLPEAILESSLISARRTAASAALAARELRRGRATAAAGLIGTGVINFETARFLLHTLPDLGELLLFDLDPERAAEAAARTAEMARGLRDGVQVRVANDRDEIFRACPLIAFATTAVKPHVTDLAACQPGATILHTSLRDLTAGAILAADNVVDDADHVSRAQTSIHLAEQQTGNRGFIRCTLADLLAGTAPAKRDESIVSVFSPFGLGVLDLAVGDLVRRRALETGKGTVIDSFLPAG